MTSTVSVFRRSKHIHFSYNQLAAAEARQRAKPRVAGPIRRERALATAVARMHSCQHQGQQPLTVGTDTQRRIRVASPLRVHTAAAEGSHTHPGGEADWKLALMLWVAHQ